MPQQLDAMDVTSSPGTIFRQRSTSVITAKAF